MTKPKASAENNNKGMVVIPYVEGLSERVSRVLKKHNISSGMRPHTTIRKLLVHPKDKLDKLNTPNCVYEIPCGNCNQTYIGETKRTFGIRMDEHKREAEKAGKQSYTRAKRLESESQNLNSAISDHVARANHVINWGESRIIEREEDRKARWIKESICIRKRGQTVMNRDEGVYNLSHIFDPLLETGNKTKNTCTGSRSISRQSSAVGSKQ